MSGSAATGMKGVWPANSHEPVTRDTSIIAIQIVNLDLQLCIFKLLKMTYEAEICRITSRILVSTAYVSKCAKNKQWQREQKKLHLCLLCNPANAASTANQGTIRMTGPTPSQSVERNYRERASVRESGAK